MRGGNSEPLPLTTGRINMITRIEFEQRYLRHAIAAGCAYETAAIVTRRLPTISNLLTRLHHSSRGRMVLWCLFGWFTIHIVDADSSVTQTILEADQ